MNNSEKPTQDNGIQPVDSFIFKIKNEVVIRIDDKGFWYKGQLIEDGGEVYRLFKDFITIAN